MTYTYTKFDVEKFKQRLSTSWIGQSIRYQPEMESTSTYARRLPEGEVAHGMLCITDNQTRGRGQYNRKWESEPGENLVFSLILTPQRSKGFHVLTLAAAHAIVECLNETMEEEDCAYIKWPNDVMMNGRKGAGILTETIFSGNELERLVIGMGLNVNQHRFPSEISGRATSVATELGEKLNRERLLADILSRFEHKYRLWQGGEKKLLKQINRSIEGYGQWVRPEVDGERKDERYKLLGINDNGRLLMLNQEGGIESFAYEQIRIIID